MLLIHTMRDIVELKSKMQQECMSGIEIRNLKEKGIASLNLLRHCWKTHSINESWNTEHICLVLQSYGLIFPIQDPFNQKVQLGPSTPRSQDSVHCSKDDGNKVFLVPCKLPPSSTDDEVLEGRPHTCTFAFDFKGFLPEDVYHRLMCLVLKRAQEVTTRKVEFVATKTTFKIFNFSECDWIMETCKHTLNVKVM